MARLDPNWREFIGTAQFFILETSGEALAEDVRVGLLAALRRSCEGAHARAVYERFQRHDTFDEFNSPTYYGVNLYALALWRGVPPTDEMAAMGRDMNAGLWRDIARFYHAGLHNLCGPFDRSYGMDMLSYNQMLGMCIALLGGDPQALTKTKKIGSTYVGIISMFASIGMELPDDARPHLSSFQGPRRFGRVINTANPRRVAQVRMEERFMVGVQKIDGLGKDSPQFHPVTMHWRSPGDALCWLRMMPHLWAHPELEGESVHVKLPTFDGRTPEGPLVFEVFAPGTKLDAFAADAWTLPGLTLGIDSSFGDPAVEIVDGVARISFATSRDGAVSLEMKPEDPWSTEYQPDGIFPGAAIAAKRDGMADVLRQPAQILGIAPLFLKTDTFEPATQTLQFSNPADLPIEIATTFKKHSQIAISPHHAVIPLNPNETQSV